MGVYVALTPTTTIDILGRNSLYAFDIGAIISRKIGRGTILTGMPCIINHYQPSQISMKGSNLFSA
jgi:hypothetical protein